MKTKIMDQKFHEGITLMNTDGKRQDGAEILMELANHGHIDSIEQLVYIFFDQKELDVAEDYINCAKDQNIPIILYLKARLIEERDGKKSALESFRLAAAHGSPHAILTMFNIAIEDRNVVDANLYFEKLKDYKSYLSILSEPLTVEALHEKLEEIKFDHGEEMNIASEIHRILTAEPVNIELVINMLEKLNLSLPAKVTISALALIQFTRLDLDEDDHEIQQEEFEEFFKEYEEQFFWDGLQGLSVSWFDGTKARALYITAVKVKAYQSGDFLARLLIKKFDDSFAFPFLATSGESIIRDLSALDSKNLSEEWLAFVNDDVEPLQDIISVSLGEYGEDYSQTESWFQDLTDKHEDLFSQEGAFFSRRYGFSFWSNHNYVSSCSKCEKRIADCQLVDCLRSVYSFSTSMDTDLYCWTDPTGGAKIIDGQIHSHISETLSIGTYRKVPYIAGFIHAPISIANDSGIWEGFAEKKGYATKDILDLQEDANYSFKELNTPENDRYIVVAWIECQLGQDNMDLFEKAIDSVKRYLNGETFFEPNLEKFQEVYAVSLFAGNWESGFKRWLKLLLQQAIQTVSNND